MRANSPPRGPSLPTWGIALALVVLGAADAHPVGQRAATLGSVPAPRRLAGGPQLAVASPTGRQEINADGYTSARVCAQCHADIYDSWKNSLHAFSLTDPIFDTAYMQAVKEAGEGARRLCLRCHAPMTVFNRDYDLVFGVTREGVSCDFCHTVTAVHLDGRDDPYEIEPGLTKRSILERAASPAHEVAYSELHGRSEFCAGCHNFRAPNGTTIMSTYDEWRAGPYAAEGRQCQNCHMVLSPGRIVEPTVKQSGTQIHLHSLIHDTEQLRSALEVRITDAERLGDVLNVEVEVENVGSGHMVPTGMPTREIVLSVRAESPTRTRSAQRRYRRVVADERGIPLNTDYAALLRGALVLNDTRIAPRETRIERFRFQELPSGPVTLSATLSYYYAPVVLSVQRMDIELGRAQRIIR